uniref:UPF0231 family protein n=1 Tax=Marinobacterium profundum TaxID=1714300 RepID=UPI000833989A|nr:YacL family protein [Marinobacterium profundum]
MEYTFGRDDIGRYFAEFSMGHEAFGHWLNDELGQNRQQLDSLLQTIDDLQQRKLREFELSGIEYCLWLTREEAQVRAHILDESAPDDELAELSFYDDELQAGCGLDDFKAVLEAWRDLPGA